MTVPTIVCFRWKPHAGYRSIYPPITVTAMRDMWRRCYPKPHRFVCITDTREDIDPDIETFPLWTDYANVPSPHPGAKNPSCYRRLKLFSAEAEAWFGPRILSIDLDCVLTGDVTHIVERPEDFVMYGDTNPRTHYNGSLVLMTAGARRQVWDDFDPATSPRAARSAGMWGSDQGWISYRLGGGEAKFGRKHGVYSYRNDLKSGGSKLPADARIVVFHGCVDPWSIRGQAIDWVKQHYGTVPVAA